MSSISVNCVVAQAFGLPLARWVGEPQGRVPGFCTPGGALATGVLDIASSPDGQRVVSESDDKELVKIWNAETRSPSERC